MLQIPLTNSTEQLFNSTIEGQKYEIRVTYNTRVGIWSISFSQNGEPIVSGIAMVAGVDIVKGYPELPFKNLYLINIEDTTEDANAENLGTVANLILFTDAEVSSV